MAGQIQVKWDDQMAERVLAIVSRTGSATKAADMVGIHYQTIHYHRRTDVEFAARYQQAMDDAFHAVLSRGMDLALDEVKPSERLIETLLKFRWPERLQSFLAVQTNSAPAGLDPAVIARMEPADRMMLASLLEKYLDAASSQPRTIDAAGPQGL